MSQPALLQSADDVLSLLSSFENSQQWPMIVDAELDPEQVSVRLRIDLAEHQFWFDGHFPDHPVLPGIVQVNWAGEVSRRLFAPHLVFSNLQSVKFQQTIGPQAVVNLNIGYSYERTRAVFEYRGDDEAVFSSGRIHFRES